MSPHLLDLMKRAARESPGFYRDMLAKDIGRALADETLARIEKALDDAGLPKLR